MISSGPEFLQIFWDLASLDSECRIEAAIRLSEYCQNLLSLMKKDVSINSWDEFEHAVHQDIVYAFKRLVRGLFSSRKGARQGFSIALIELLKALTSLTSLNTNIFINYITQSFCESVIDGREECAQDKKDLMFAKIFGYQVVLKADIPINDIFITGLISDLANLFAKPFLREMIFQVLRDLVETQFSGRNSFVRETLEKYECFWNPVFGGGLDSVYLKLKVFELDQSFPCPINDCGVIQTLSFSYHQSLTSWKGILSHVIKKSKGENSLSFFIEFWNTAVDPLFSSSYERRHTGLEIFKFALPLLINSGIPVSLIFSPRLMNCVMNNQKKQNKLFVEVGQCVELLLHYMEKDAKISLQFISALDSAGNSKILRNSDLVSRIMKSSFSQEGSGLILEQYVDWMISFYDKSSVSQKKWCIDQLIGLVKCSELEKSEKILMRIHSFVCELLSKEDVHECIKKSFWCLLSILTFLDVSWISKSNDAFKKLQETNKNLDKAKKIAKRVRKSYNCCPYLLALLELELTKFYVIENFNKLDEIEEMEECIKRLYGKDQTKGSDLSPQNVLVDLFISFLSRGSSQEEDLGFSKISKYLCNKAFTQFCASLDENGIEVILNVLSDKDSFCEEEEEKEETDNGDESDSDESEDDMSFTENGDFADMVKDNDVQLSDLDDDQMIEMGFDDKIAEIFKNKKANVKTNKLLERETMDFKFRILNLIEIYAKTCSKETNKFTFNNLLLVTKCFLKTSVSYSCSKFDASIKDKRDALISKMIYLLHFIFKIKYPREDVGFSSELFWEAVGQTVHCLTNQNAGFSHESYQKNYSKDLAVLSGDVLIWLFKLGTLTISNKQEFESRFKHIFSHIIFKGYMNRKLIYKKVLGDLISTRQNVDKYIGDSIISSLGRNDFDGSQLKNHQILLLFQLCRALLNTDVDIKSFGNVFENCFEIIKTLKSSRMKEVLSVMFDFLKKCKKNNMMGNVDVEKIKREIKVLSSEASCQSLKNVSLEIIKVIDSSEKDCPQKKIKLH